MPDGDDGDGRLGLLVSSADRVLSRSFRAKLLMVCLAGAVSSVAWEVIEAMLAPVLTASWASDFHGHPTGTNATRKQFACHMVIIVEDGDAEPTPSQQSTV